MPKYKNMKIYCNIYTGPEFIAVPADVLAPMT